MPFRGHLEPAYLTFESSRGPTAVALDPYKSGLSWLFIGDPEPQFARYGCPLRSSAAHIRDNRSDPRASMDFCKSTHEVQGNELLNSAYWVALCHVRKLVSAPSRR